MIEETTLGVIKDLGFPVFMVLLMFYQNHTVLKQNTIAIQKLTRMIGNK